MRSIDAGPSDRVRAEWRARASLVLSTLMHAQAGARLSAEERQELERLGGLSLAEAAETGRELVRFTPTEVMALADRIENPWDHSGMRQAIEAFRHEGAIGVESRGLRAALLRRARHELNGRRT